MLQGLIKINYPLHALLIDNGWLEFDTINDYNLYSKMLNDKTLENLIKLNY